MYTASAFVTVENPITAILRYGGTRNDRRVPNGFFDGSLPGNRIRNEMLIEVDGYDFSHS